MAKKRKAFMVASDKAEMVMLLSDADAGKLFKAIFLYNEGDGCAGDSLKGKAKVAFSAFKTQLDWSNEQYKRVCERNRKNGALGGRPKTQKPKITQNNPDEPKEKEKAKEKAKAKPKSKSKSKAKSALPDIYDGGDGDDDVENVESVENPNVLSAWKGVVMLTENQVEVLLNTMTLEEFNYYLAKLADFINQKDAKIKNHYQTMLKWYEEDRRI